MSFQDELKANFNGQVQERYSFSAARVDQAAEEIVEVVKADMLRSVRTGNVKEYRSGLFGTKTVRVVEVIVELHLGSYAIHTPYRCTYDGELTNDWTVHDEKEKRALVKAVKQKCSREKINVRESVRFEDRLEFSAGV